MPVPSRAIFDGESPSPGNSEDNKLTRVASRTNRIVAEVPSGTATAAGFVARASWPVARFLVQERAAYPFREPLRFTVTSVTVVTLPISTGFLCDGPLVGSPYTVTPIVTEKSPSLWGSLPSVTVVTLVTVACRLFLDKGRHLYFVGSLISAT